MKYTCQMNQIGNKAFICGGGNCGHTGSQRGLMNIVRGVAQGLTAYRKHFLIGFNGGYQKPTYGRTNCDFGWPAY